MEELRNFFALGILIVMWSHWFTPLQTFKRLYIVEPLIKRGQFWFLDSVWPHLNCTKCLGLWIGLVVYVSIPMALLLSACTYILGQILKD